MPTAFVTGASRGLGLEFARQYAADGWDVLAAARDPGRADGLNALAAGSGRQIEVVGLDVADAGEVARVARDLGGRAIDLLVNNAGVWGGERQHLPDIDFEEWLRTLQVNTLGPVRVSLALLPNVEAGRARKIVALTSGLGSIGDNTSGRYYAYRSSKAGLNAAFRSLALDLKGRGIAVAVLSPGWARTDMGGPNATLSAPESVADMRRVIGGWTCGGAEGSTTSMGRRCPGEVGAPGSTATFNRNEYSAALYLAYGDQHAIVHAFYARSSLPCPLTLT